MKKMTRLLAVALSAVLIAGGILPVSVEAASVTLSRVGKKERSVTVGKEFELEVKKSGKLSDKKIKWSIGDTSIVKFDDDDRYGDDIDLKAVKAGTTTVKAKNLDSGKSVSYKITVKKAKADYTIKKVGSTSKTVEVDDDIELEVKKGASLKESQIKWSISDTSILRFEDGDNKGSEVEVEARKKGTTKVTAKNTKTGEKIVYTIKVVPEVDD